MNGALAWCGHDLVEHSKNTLLLILDPGRYTHADRIRVDRLKFEVKGVTARLSRILGLGGDEARRLLALAACLHDAGKLLPQFQERAKKLCSIGQEERLSFKGHELLSTWLAWHVFEALGYSNGIRAAYASGIALHHSARRSLHEALIYLKIVAGNLQGMVGASLNLVRECLGTLDLKPKASTLGRIEALLNYRLTRPNPISSVLSQLANNRSSKYGELVAYVVSVVDSIDSYFHRKRAERPLLVARPYLAESIKST